MSCPLRCRGAPPRRSRSGGRPRPARRPPRLPPRVCGCADAWAAATTRCPEASTSTPERAARAATTPSPAPGNSPRGTAARRREWRYGGRAGAATWSRPSGLGLDPTRRARGQRKVPRSRRGRTDPPESGTGVSTGSRVAAGAQAPSAPPPGATRLRRRQGGQIGPDQGGQITAKGTRWCSRRPCPPVAGLRTCRRRPRRASWPPSWRTGRRRPAGRRRSSAAPAD